MAQATSNLINMSSDELKELLNDDSKLDDRIKNAVSFHHKYLVIKPLTELLSP